MLHIGNNHSKLDYLESCDVASIEMIFCTFLPVFDQAVGVTLTRTMAVSLPPPLRRLKSHQLYSEPKIGSPQRSVPIDLLSTIMYRGDYEEGDDEEATDIAGSL